MRYEERNPKLFYILFLIAIFIIIYSPWYLNLRELIGSEGKYGSMAIDMLLTNPTNFAHGESLASTYPLYPWIVSILYKLGLNIEYALRGVSILALLGISLIVFETTRRISSLSGACVACCFVFSNIFVLEKAIDGNPFTLTVLLLLSGWILWYYFGILKGNWNIAWVLGLFFAGLAFFTIGWFAILYFFIPLVFMRRPLTLWNKLKYPGFTIGLFIIVFFILIWIIPQITNNISTDISSGSFLNDLTETYLKDILVYPFNIVGGFMPWAIIAWPAFCVAYHPLDDNPIFSRFLRIIFFSLFFTLWFNPFSTTRDFIILVPPVAILTGTNYWLLIRRHGHILQKIFNYLTLALIVLNIGALILFFIPNNIWNSYFPFTYLHNEYFESGIGFIQTFSKTSIIQLSLGIALGFFLLILRKKRIAIWFRAVSLSIMFMLFFWSVTYPYRSQQNDAQSVANTINTALSKSTSNPRPIIYKGPHIADIYILSCYINGKIEKIYSYNQIPRSQKDIYVFTLSTPIFPERIWKEISKVKYKDKSLYLWEGKLIEE